MNFSILFKIIGSILLVLSISMSVPLVYGLIVGEGGAVKGFSISVFITLLLGGLLFLSNRKAKEDELRPKEGFFIVAMIWLLISLAGGLPFYFSKCFGDYSFSAFVSGFFESASGFSTTGATVFTVIETVPRSILLWRSTTHWLGGMGIIVLSLLMLPLLGVSGFQLFRAEVPGMKTDMAKLHPRIKDTAKALWIVYLIFTIGLTGLLLLGGMDMFDAINHAFATMATGGFSTKNKSIESFNSAYIEIVITIFMIIAGANFALHYYALKGKLYAYLKDLEFKVYIAVVAFATTAVTGVLANHGATISDSARLAAFQVASILTTTGFSSTNFELWPRLALIVILFMMFIGGCAGSTGGGVKVMRVILYFKLGFAELFRLIHPNSVKRVKLSGQAIDEKMSLHVWGFFFLAIFTFLGSTIIIFATGVDLVSSITSVIACLGNIGPGFGSVGPADNYAHFTPFVKIVQIFCMITGRLELFTVYVLFSPQFWKN